MDAGGPGDSSGEESIVDPGSLQENNFSCRFCDQTFSSQSTLARHERTHTGERLGERLIELESTLEFPCEVCSESFDSEAGLAKHWNVQHPDEKLFKCDLCDMRFSQSSQLRKHNSTHNVTRDHRCEYCDKCFATGPNLARHKVVHPEYRRSVGVKPVKCRRCNKRFSRQDYLKRHMRLHCTYKPFQCKICRKGFPSESALTEHQAKHSESLDKDDEPEDIRCEVCLKTFTRWRSLEMHIRLQHSSTTVHKCEHCDKTFAYSYNLSRHRKQHLIERKKSFPCQECHRSYSRRDSLANHRKIHLGLMKYRCDRCSVLFEREDQLNRHKEKHLNQLPRRTRSASRRTVPEGGEAEPGNETLHRCGHCPMSFKRKVDLHRHEKAHLVHNVEIFIRSTDSSEDRSSEYFHPDDDDYDYTLNTELEQVEHDLNMPDIAPVKPQRKVLQASPTQVVAPPREQLQVKLEPPEVLLKEVEIKKEPVDDYDVVAALVDEKPSEPHVLFDAKPKLPVRGASSGTNRQQSSEKACPQNIILNGSGLRAKKSGNSSATQLTRISMKAPRSFVSFRQGRKYTQFSIFKTSGT